MKIRRFFATFLTAIVAITPMASMPAAADESYAAGDVNRDGRITIADAIFLNSYIAGAYKLSDYSRLDVNGSLTVDAADVAYIYSIMGGLSYSAAYLNRETGNTVAFPTVSGFTAEPDIDAEAGRVYRRYSYESNQELPEYTLTPSTTAFPDSSSGNTRGIIGDDSRYPSYGEECTGLVYLTAIDATGFIVGDHTIATAAHCVYDIGSSSWRDNEIETYDANGCLTGTYLTPVEAHVPQSFTLSSSSTQLADDYALITVEENLYDYFQFDLGSAYNITANNFQDVPLYLTGCPDYVGTVGTSDSENLSNRLYTGQGTVYSADLNAELKYTNDTFAGNSGSPVYTITRVNQGGSVIYYYTVLAVHSYSVGSSYNGGMLMTKYLRQFYLDNIYASY